MNLSDFRSIKYDFFLFEILSISFYVNLIYSMSKLAEGVQILKNCPLKKRKAFAETLRTARVKIYKKIQVDILAN